MRQAIDAGDELLAKMVTDLMDGGGKRLRPALVILASKFHRADEEKLIGLAASVEMLHTATLVHDDMIDHSLFRRGTPTLNSRWKDEIAVLVGDYLFASAAKLAAETQNPHIISIFAQTLMRICTSEVKEALRRWKPAREDYYQRISQKTACLFAAATETGSILSGALEEESQALRSYGHNLGMAFQIVDDILDFTGEERELGKPIGSDLRQGIITLPTIYFLEENPDGGKGNPVPEGELESLIESIKVSGAIGSSRAEAQGFTEKAKEALAPLPANRYRQMMLDLADLLLTRRV